MQNPGDSSIPLILVVDDDDDIRALAKAILEDEGYRVVVAERGMDGIAAFVAETPDCILLDVRMPDVDGFEVCRRIRGLPHGTTVPILFLTSLRDVDTFDQSLRAGGNDFLTKPIRPTEIAIRVRTMLEMRRMGVEIREHFELIGRQRADMLRVQFQKERLMAFVVHDLKNPVGSIDLHAQLLLREPGLSASTHETAAHIRADARQLTRMILNLLDVSKADEGKLVPRRTDVDLRSLLAAVVADLESAAEYHHVRVRSVVGVERIRADEDLLRRTLTNLVENAIRHAPRDKDVTVTSNADGDRTQFRVVDAGVGVPAEMRQKIFDPFVQVESGERVVARSGRGLGLAFCKLATEAHGGRIWVEDAAPGAAFCVSLPNEP